jgi:tRNA A-37 threonylcarbamoyl transferase component Bud32
MRILDKIALDALLADASTIEQDGHGLKVAQLASGHFLKLYRRKRLLSSALLVAPAERFARNAERLLSLGVSAPIVIDTLKVPDLAINGLIYQPLPGETLRVHWRGIAAQQRDDEAYRLGDFLGQLHALGVYFRSLHLGNVLLLPDQRFGLIDLSDMRISGRPLAHHKRTRNVGHMLRHHEDRDWLASEHRSALLHGYAIRAGEAAAKRLGKALKKS